MQVCWKLADKQRAVVSRRCMLWACICPAWRTINWEIRPSAVLQQVCASKLFAGRSAKMRNAKLVASCCYCLQVIQKLWTIWSGKSDFNGVAKMIYGSVVRVWQRHLLCKQTTRGFDSLRIHHFHFAGNVQSRTKLHAWKVSGARKRYMHVESKSLWRCDCGWKKRLEPLVDFLDCPIV